MKNTINCIMLWLLILLPATFAPVMVCASYAPQNSNSECDPSSNEICFNVPIGDTKSMSLTNALSDYIALWYSFIIGAIGIFATVMIMYGGIKWLTSRGNSAVIGDAKEKIFSALIGLVLAFLSYTILYLINPNLTIIKTPNLPSISDISYNSDTDYSQEVTEREREDNVRTTYDILDMEKKCPGCEITEITPDSKLYGGQANKEFIARGNKDFYNYIEAQGEKFTGIPDNYIPGCGDGQHCYKIDSGNWLGETHNTYWYWETDDKGGYWRVIVW